MRQWQWRNAPADADIDREEGAFAEVAVSDFSMQSDSDIYPEGLRGFPQLACCAGVFLDRFTTSDPFLHFINAIFLFEYNGI